MRDIGSWAGEDDEREDDEAWAADVPAWLTDALDRLGWAACWAVLTLVWVAILVVGALVALDQARIP